MPDTLRTPRRVFHYSNSSTPRRSPSPTFESPSGPRYQASPFGDAGLRILSAPHRPARHISRTAIKILDAPELQDDFYLNLVDWGNNDCLAVGLGSCVYLWNANTSRVTKLCDFVNDAISSVSWAKQGSHLAIGTNKGAVLLWDTETSRRVRTWSGHTSRTGALAWSSNILTSGSRDHKIYHRDVRSPSQYFRELNEHVQEVCGLKWNEEGTMLASGGNDNNLLIWSSHQNNLLWKFRDHTAAVKAIGWSPHTRGMLASGGGTADKTIKFWNAISGAAISSHDTGSQVCNVAWSKKTNEIVSTHGYASNSDNSSNQVIVWKANNMQRVATLSGHSSRVLYMSLSQDGSTVVTGAGDETLRFWDVFSTAEVIRREPEDRRECLR
ncbi:WD40-repeat-containing domain protein [Zychaea mexicana]|uniref:WD40-repeat-containing domain protein n=1 Tax=Zychaea mexicana TaxID=64656 RepID=UPI0022FEAB68|nr:WD40-repeat-containing domain protein [Zychaea mexicana]KAI9489047.1 WD40-repeat-containing domain protein [Zychaea mexicana]